MNDLQQFIHRHALHFIRRAEYLLSLNCGLNHPNAAALYTNTSMILLELRAVKAALKYLHK